MSSAHPPTVREVAIEQAIASGRSNQWITEHLDASTDDIAAAWQRMEAGEEHARTVTG